MEAELKIERQIQDGICFLVWTGSLDSQKMGQVNGELRSIIDDGQLKIICDVSKVRPISSASLGAIYTKQQELKERGGEIVLLGDNRSALQMLEILDAKKLFKVTKRREEAFQVFGIEPD